MDGCKPMDIIYKENCRFPLLSVTNKAPTVSRPINLHCSMLSVSRARFIGLYLSAINRYINTVGLSHQID